MRIERRYSALMRKLADAQKEGGGRLVIRHDVDYDIRAAKQMAMLEQLNGLSSVIYLDPCSKAYGKAEAVRLIEDFRITHEFGVHVSHMYHYDAGVAETFLKTDIEGLSFLAPRMPTTVSAHFYSAKMKTPLEFSNRDLVEKVCPDRDFMSWYFPDEKPLIMSDSGGVMYIGGRQCRGFDEIVEALRAGETCCVHVHPVHWETDNGDLIFTGKMGWLDDLRWKEVGDVQRELFDEGRISTYLATPVEKLEHVVKAAERLLALADENFMRLIRVTDYGCAIGLLAFIAVQRSNLKYTGLDVDRRWIEAGRELHERLEIWAPMRVGSLFDEDRPKADVGLFLAAEDWEFDWALVMGAAAAHEHFLFTTVNRERYDAARARGKGYNWVEPDEVRKMAKERGLEITGQDMASGRWFWQTKRNVI